MASRNTLEPATRPISFVRNGTEQLIDQVSLQMSQRSVTNQNQKEKLSMCQYQQGSIEGSTIILARLLIGYGGVTVEVVRTQAKQEL